MNIFTRSAVLGILSLAISSFALLMLGGASAYGQSTFSGPPQINLDGFIDVFYAYDLDGTDPRTTGRQSFLYNHNRHNEFNLNLGLIRLNIDHPRYRSTLALQTGTFPQDNMIREPAISRLIFEATAGLAIDKKGRLWFDAGIFPSHIGFESAISADNPTLTRSLVAENSPYYLTGAKLTFAPNEKWEFELNATNGWQVITRPDPNAVVAFGSRATYNPSEGITLNWSTFVGSNDQLFSNRRARLYSNLYALLKVGQKWDFIAGLDVGWQEDAFQSNSFETWYTPTIIAQYTVNEQWKTAARFEYFNDELGLIIQDGFDVTGASLNVDFAPNEFVLCRVEGRWMGGNPNTFENATGFTDADLIIAASISVRFAAVLYDRK